jgi:hypothetical protein
MLRPISRIMGLSLRTTLTACAVLVLLGASHQEARAGFTLDLGNAAIQGVTGPGSGQLTAPYGTLDIVGNTTTGLLTFTLSASAQNAGSPINAVYNDISFNTHLTLGTDFTLVSASNGGTIGAGGNVSVFGNFKYTVGGSGNSDRENPYVFVLQLADPSKATAENFTLANSDGKTFAAHLYTDIGSGGTTGFISMQGSVVATPAPAGLVLLASAAPVLLLRRFVRRKTIVSS